MLNARFVAAALLIGCSSPSEPSQPPPIARVAIATPPVVVPPAPTTPVADPALERDPVAAWTLTASDGSGLRLVKVSAAAVVEGPLAFTELHLRFENPEDRVREGTFAITLPQHAAVSRFAMEDNGKLTEAEVVPKMLARRAYDDMLHRGIDPAILEKAAGNQFTARVFPIPARGVKHIVISYSHELAGEGYLLPLRGLPKIDEVSVTLDAARADGSRQPLVLHEQDWVPNRDFVASVTAPAAVATGALVAGTFDVSPTAGANADRPTALSLLVDTSASRAVGFERYMARVRELVHQIAIKYDAVELEVLAFDQETQKLYSGPAKDFGDAAIAAFVERGAAGASDLSQAAKRLTAQRRVVVITDGVVTAGLDNAELTAAFAKLETPRVDVVLAGGIRDEMAASKIARTGKRAGDVFDLDREIAPVARGLGEAVRKDVPIEIAGATWFYPRTLASLRAGTQVMVFAKLATPGTAFQVKIGGSEQTVPVMQATPALLERAAARVQIDELESALASTPATNEKAIGKLRKDIEKRSVAARVVSSQTTMLVLETDADYAQYGIDRKALADILVVGPKGLEQSHRTYTAKKKPKQAPVQPADGDDAQIARQEAIEQARNAGYLGSTALSSGGGFASLTSGFDSTGTGMYPTIGHSSVGGDSYTASGHGFAAGGGAGHMRARVASVPTVSIAQPMVAGDLDKSFIRRYIKRNIEKITYCYESQLLGHPELHGTVNTTFVITANGTVSSATATGVDETVAKCVADVIKAIEFPKVTGGGVVQVNYPFTFRRAGTDDEEAAPPVDVRAAPAPVDTRAALVDPVVDQHVEREAPPPPEPEGPAFAPPIDALDGTLKDITRAIAHKKPLDALAMAKKWHDEKPTDVLAWVGLGQAWEASGDKLAAARAYGSIIDLYGSRAEYRRFAGERLERAGERALAIDTYRRAVADRPDQVSGHRLLAYALVRNGEHAAAWKAILAAADQETRADSYAGAPRIFAKDVAMIASAYAAHGGSRAKIQHELDERSIEFATTPSTRFILYWETDANDVDLHVRDAKGGHAYFGSKTLPSGGELYADVTTGFGPECFEIDGKPSAGPYELGVHYYAQGPMGYGMGSLQIERFDGKAFTFDDRPFVIMRNQAYVALGRTK